MAERSEELRAEIEDTRERMGETVDALAYKADVPTRTKEWIGEKKDAVTEAVTGKVSDVTPDADEVKVRARRMRRTAERNPLGLAIGGAAVGFVAGLLTPSTRVEDEKLGPMADELRSTASEAGREAVERGKQVVQEAGETAVETAKERGREESEELSTSLQDKAREVTSPGSDAAVFASSSPKSSGSAGRTV
jgi:gas vesicle protein